MELHPPQTLYRRWEANQWSPFDIDLDADRRQWREMAAEDRSVVLWALSSLMVAEERITTKFAGLLLAHGSEEEATFLATQQVDEARHMQFYARFQDDVIADPRTIATHVTRSREQLTPAFSKVFDEALARAHARLVAHPEDTAAKVDFVTTYHLMIEGTLGLTAFHFISRYLQSEDVLPGFLAGYSRIHHDEHRHIGYGVWFLRTAVQENPALGERVRNVLRGLLPVIAESLAPPGLTASDWNALGATSDEIREFALDGLSRRLNVVGVPLDSV